MMRVTVALLSVLVLVGHLEVSLAGPYGGHPAEEAPFSVVRKEKNYEIRLYPESKWVCTDTLGKEYKIRDQAKAFYALSEYIMGENAEGTKMTMAAPLTVRTVLKTDSQENTLFQMCLYIPKMYQKNTPEPNEEGVFIQHRLPITVAVRQFSGSMMQKTEWGRQMEMLRADLMAAKESKMDFNDSYGVGYDPSFKADAGDNEVWITKKE